MKVAFFTEGQYTGGIPRNHPNMRTDVAWICALNAVHHPINRIHELQEEFDLGVAIIPKHKESLFDYPLIENMKRICKKTSMMQESTYWYWQGEQSKHNYGIIIYYNLWILFFAIMIWI